MSLVETQWVNSPVVVDSSDWKHIQLTFTPESQYSYLYIGYMGNVGDATSNAWSDGGSSGFYIWVDELSVTKSIATEVVSSLGKYNM